MARQLALSIAFASVTILTAGLATTGLAQSLNGEAALTGGATTESLAAFATQVRAFGDVRGWHFYTDGSWAATHGTESDAFGAAYPYDSKVRLMELKVEKTLVSESKILGVRLGRYRTPFGIYSGSDQGYLGFLRAPLVRNSYYWTLSNNYLETGASLIGGTTWLSGETSVGTASDQDQYARRGGLNAVARIQAAHGSWIAGVSYVHTRPATTRLFAKGYTQLGGADVRWMKSGVQLRGEWMAGRPFNGTAVRGGYADLLVHRPIMGPITAVARIERVDYLAHAFSEYPRRYTAGVKIRLAQNLTAEINEVHQPYDVISDPGHTSLDFGLTYTFRTRLAPGY